MWHGKLIASYWEMDGSRPENLHALPVETIVMVPKLPPGFVPILLALVRDGGQPSTSSSNGTILPFSISSPSLDMPGPLGEAAPSRSFAKMGSGKDVFRIAMLVTLPFFLPIALWGCWVAWRAA